MLIMWSRGIQLFQCLRGALLGSLLGINRKSGTPKAPIISFEYDVLFLEALLLEGNLDKRLHCLPVGHSHASMRCCRKRLHQFNRKVVLKAVTLEGG